MNLQQGHHKDDDENLGDEIAGPLVRPYHLIAVHCCDIQISRREERIEDQMRDRVDAAFLGLSDGEGDEFYDNPGDIGYDDRTHAY